MKQLNLRNVLSYLKNYSGTQNLTEYDNVLAFTIQYANRFITDLTAYVGTSPLPFTADWMDNESDTGLTASAELIINKVVERYSHELVKQSFYDLTEDDIEEAIELFMDSFLNVLDNTYNKYDKLLSLYEAKKNNLMDGMGFHEVNEYGRTDTGSGKSRFNDTPQNYDEDGATFDDEDHTTNMNISESSLGVEGGSETTRDQSKMDVMEKLENIERLYQNVLLNWSREFGRLFVYSSNYNGGNFK